MKKYQEIYKKVRELDDMPYMRCRLEAIIDYIINELGYETRNGNIIKNIIKKQIKHEKENNKR